MKRRDLLKLGGVAAVGAGIGRLAPGPAAAQTPGQMPMGTTPQAGAPAGAADFTLRIAPVVVQLEPRQAISTIGYNGMSPGPVLRMKEGKQVTVDVFNDTDVPELVHWHGFFIPPEMDGAEEEGSPLVPPHGHFRYQFVPRPSGTRWYHSHQMAMADLHRGIYTGQFGFAYIEPANNPGRYDQEIFLALREWEPYFSAEDMDDSEPDPNDPMPEAPKTPDTRVNGMEVGYRNFSINDKSLGAGEPIRVKQGQRVLMHILNASATSNRGIAMSGHRFQVVGLDGNPVPTPQMVDSLQMGPAERIDAIVEMNRPGIWVLGTTRDQDREGGMGVLVEYENRQSDPEWIAPPKKFWDYTIFGKAGGKQPAPDQTIDMLVEKIPGGPGKFNHWTINGKEYPHEGEFSLKEGGRYRLVIRNRSDDDHPVHIHRHLFEIVAINGKPSAGVMKDTISVPTYGHVTVDLVADQPGLTLFHCHNQIHMDFGFKALFRYS